MRQHGIVAWSELLSRDPAKAKAFFGETLGWTFEDFSFGGPAYWVIRSGAEMVGGLGGLDAGDVETDESYWITFIEVEEIDRRFQLALDLGATAIREPHEVPNVGRVAVLRDPTGALVGWIRGEE